MFPDARTAHRRCRILTDTEPIGRPVDVQPEACFYGSRHYRSVYRKEVSTLENNEVEDLETLRRLIRRRPVCAHSKRLGRFDNASGRV